MKQTVGSTWIYQLVILFILMFVSFLILTLTYSKSYRTKNELINIIERQEGVNHTSIGIINSYLKSTGYNVTHTCPDSPNWLGAFSLESDTLERVRPSVKYYYCIRREINKGTGNKKNGKAGYEDTTMYYELKIFFKFSLPVVENIGTFTTDGTTDNIFRNPDIYNELK